MQYIIGIDDTDNLESRGTGHLARVMATALAQDFQVYGVTRHQLLQDKRVPMTAKNSSASIIFEGNPYPLEDVATYARKMLLDDFQPGSDPGLCVASNVSPEITVFGERAQREFLYQQEARDLAAAHGLYLEGLGGTEGGVIGALAAVGLAAGGEDGRYVHIGTIRELAGMQPVSAVLAAGIRVVQTVDALTITDGFVLTDKIRPARRGGQPVLFVERQADHWLPLKLD
jgi:tRNA(Ile2) C34 agmatinyltransferase TiaS